MRKILFISLLCLVLMTSVFGQTSILQQKPMHGLQVNKLHQLGDPVAIWLFNEGSGNKVFDLSGNDYEMDFINSPVWSPGNTGSAILFDDGSSQLLHRGDICGLISYPFSIVCWFNVDDNSSNQTLVGICDADDPGDYHMLWLRDTPDVDVVISSIISGVGSANAFSAKSFSTNTWHMAAGVWAGAQDRRVYIDGGSKGTNVADSVAWPNLVDNTTIGGRRRDGSDSNFVSGKISLVLIYNRILTDSEVALLYRELFCMFEEDLPVSLMYSYAAPPPGVGQVIIIQTAIPIFLIFGCVVLIRQKRKAV